MPLYEYFCEDCQKEFTLLQPASVNKQETTCPQCESARVTYKFSTFTSKIQKVTASSRKIPVTEDDFPNKDIFKLPIPRHISEL